MLELNNSWQLKPNCIVKNHFVLSPMVNRQSEVDGCVGINEQEWLVRRAKGGFGMIITSATNVSPNGQTWANQLSVHSDKHIAGLTNLAQQLTKNGAISILQIFHGGARCPSVLINEQPLSASSFHLNEPNFEQPRSATESEIEQIIEDFVNGAKRAYTAGFTGVEIHGANGYLLTQFISPQTNFRTDKFGGSLENRAHLIRTIMQRCKHELPNNFVIGVRLSPENRGIQSGLDIDESVTIAKWLVEDGADYIHLSTSDVFKHADKYPEIDKSLVEYFTAILNGKPLLAAGGLQSIAQMEKALNLGVSGVALGRIAIANPDIPNLAKNDTNYQPILPPYTKEQLEAVKVSYNFYEYLLAYPGFIKQG